MSTVRTLIGYVKGPKGDKGDTGATGAQGPAGQNGAPGVTDYATTEAAGLVRVGDDFNINSSNGILSVKNVWTKASTLAAMVSGEAFSTALGKIAKALDTVITIAGDYLKSTDIVDSLTSALTNKALSANKGKELKDGLDSLNDSITTLNNSLNGLVKTKEITVTTSSIGAVALVGLTPGNCTPLIAYDIANNTYKIRRGTSEWVAIVTDPADNDRITNTEVNVYVRYIDKTN